MNKKWLIYILSTFFLATLFFVTAFADETKEEANKGTGAAFSVLPIYPDNQVNGKNGYFELNVAPKQNQVLQIELQNYSEKTITIDIEANRATTSDAGITSYKKSKNEKDDTLKVDFESLVHLEEQEVALKAKEKKTIKITLQMPDESFVGQVLGGIHFSQKPDEKEKNEKKNAVYNTFSYSIAVLLTENKQQVENQLKLIDVYADQRNYRNFIEARIQNAAPTMIKNLSVKSEIFEKNSSKASYQANKTSLRMAPNSTFNFGLDLQNTELIPGDYTLKMTADADGKEYKFSKDFTISRKQANELNDQAVYIEKKDNKQLYMIIAGILLVVIVVVIILIKRKRANKKKQKNKKGKKRKKKRK